MAWDPRAIPTTGALRARRVARSHRRAWIRPEDVGILSPVPPVATTCKGGGGRAAGELEAVLVVEALGDACAGGMGPGDSGVARSAVEAGPDLRQKAARQQCAWGRRDPTAATHGGGGIRQRVGKVDGGARTGLPRRSASGGKRIDLVVLDGGGRRDRPTAGQGGGGEPDRRRPGGGGEGGEADRQRLTGGGRRGETRAREGVGRGREEWVGERN